jgi:hypothetical protein
MTTTQNSKPEHPMFRMQRIDGECANGERDARDTSEVATHEALIAETEHRHERAIVLMMYAIVCELRELGDQLREKKGE